MIPLTELYIIIIFDELFIVHYFSSFNIFDNQNCIIIIIICQVQKIYRILMETFLLSMDP